MTINLSRNNLKHIPSEIIYTLDSLELLDLSSQAHPIRRIEDFAFDRESHKRPIKRIALHNNSIAVIARRAFCARSNGGGGGGNKPVPRYANIKELDLTENALTSVDACVLRQLARGYSEPIYTSKLKLYARVLFGGSADELPLEYGDEAARKPKRLVECSCELTRANKLVDLDGFCRRRSDSLTVWMKQYDCGDYSITNANQVSIG